MIIIIITYHNHLKILLMLSPTQPSSSNNKMECLKLKICTNNQLLKFLCDKVLNIDVKNVVLEKSLDKLEEDDLLRVNVNLSGLTYVLECKLIDKNIVLAEPFNFSSLLDLDAMDYTNITPTIQTLGEINLTGDRHALLRSHRFSEEDLARRLLHSSSSSSSNNGSTAVLPTTVVDEATSNKLDKLLNQNEKILDLLSNIEKKHDVIIKQNEKIIEHQVKHDSFLEHFSNFAISNPETNARRQYNEISFGQPTSTIRLKSTPSSDFQSQIRGQNNNKNAVCTNESLSHKHESHGNYDYIDSNATSTANTTHNTSADFDDDGDSNSEHDDKLCDCSTGHNYSFHHTGAESLSSEINSIPTTSFVTEVSKTSKKKGDKSHELTQKEFNRKMKACILQSIPNEDQQLGIMEMCEKHPEKVSQIKNYLKSFVPKGSTFNTAWSKALHSIRQHKYMERKKK